MALWIFVPVVVKRARSSSSVMDGVMPQNLYAEAPVPQFILQAFIGWGPHPQRWWPCRRHTVTRRSREDTVRRQTASPGGVEKPKPLSA